MQQVSRSSPCWLVLLGFNSQAAMLGGANCGGTVKIIQQNPESAYHIQTEISKLSCFTGGD